MTNNDHTLFLNYIKNYVESNPEVAPRVSECVQIGLTNKLNDLKQQTVDMEVALVVSLERKTKNSNTIILDKLKKWKDKTFLKWDDWINDLEEKVK